MFNGVYILKSPIIMTSGCSRLNTYVVTTLTYVTSVFAKHVYNYFAPNGISTIKIMYI